MTNELAFHIVSNLGWQSYKTFYDYNLTDFHNKLERFSIASLSSLV